MNRRGFLQTLVAGSAAGTLPSCGSLAASRPGGHPRVMTVTGPIDASQMGITLTHEHLFANLQPYAEWAQKALPYDRDEVVDVVLPHLPEFALWAAAR